MSVSNESGRWVVRIAGTEVDRSDLWHVRAFPWPGKLEGLSPVAYARESIGLGIAAEKYGARFFGDSAIPSGYLYSDQRMDEPKLKQVQAQWEASGRGRRGTAVLSQMKYQTLSIAPEEAQFLGTIKANVATICRLYGVPPGMMAGSELGGHEDYSSPEQRATDLLTFTLRPGSTASNGRSPRCCRGPNRPSSTRAPSSGPPSGTATKPTSSPSRRGS